MRLRQDSIEESAPAPVHGARNATESPDLNRDLSPSIRIAAPPQGFEASGPDRGLLFRFAPVDLRLSEAEGPILDQMGTDWNQNSRSVPDELP